jgi:hypothetical protein
MTKWYFILMGTCLTLYPSVGFVVRFYSAAAVAGSATINPPIAAVVANAGREGARNSTTRPLAMTSRRLVR